ncbi:MAG TPA: lytic transglycosylase domain-containing protein, partial [Gemmatimonadota bacterium]|nr:lytic transglycosylase domain-containing protein [Gemmatimonadota bacterium]
MSRIAVFFALTLLLIPARPVHAQDDPFDVPIGLERAVDFWKRVYGDWSQDQVVFHDRDDLGVVYRVLDQKKSDDRETYRANEAEQEAIVRRIRSILLDLAARNPDPRTLSGDYEDVYEAFGPGANPAIWRKAADNIRVQRGLKEKFMAGLLHAGQYHDHIVAILEEEGVPEELAWLPMVESTFNLQARSSVGAAGVWQFMPATGRIYLRMDRSVDERFDPILAARGAARYLRNSYDDMGSWPLAITSYNHGYYGMMRAIRELGTTDYMTVRRQYKGPAFGFASKNFYAEFLAALEIAENPLVYFGEMDPFDPLEFDTYEVESSIGLHDVANALRVDPGRLWQLNPSLTDDVWRGRRNIPAGFLMRLPPGYGHEAPSQLAA